MALSGIIHKARKNHSILSRIERATDKSKFLLDTEYGIRLIAKLTKERGESGGNVIKQHVRFD